MGRILVNMKYIKLFEDWTAENPDLERVRQFNGSIKDMHTWLSRKLKEQGLEGETNPYKHTIMVNGPHMDDKFLLDELKAQGEMFGMQARNCSPDKWLQEGDEVTIGELSLKVYFCPGHTPGHIIYFNKASKLALVGDVLFKGSIGRTDLPGGNHQDLLDSIAKKLWPLGNDVEFIPGHGPISTFGQERINNVFVADNILNNS